MSTKLDPGQYDCYKKLADDEPYFLLRAKDPHAPAIVELWAALREAEFGPSAKFLEARACAQEMREWFTSHNGVPLSKRQTLAASPQAGAKREGGQAKDEILDALNAARNFVRGRHSTISYGPRKLVEQIESAIALLASPPSGEPGREPFQARVRQWTLAARASVESGLREALRELNSLQHKMAIELDSIPQQPRIEYWTRKMEAVIVTALATPAPSEGNEDANRGAVYTALAQSGEVAAERSKGEGVLEHREDLLPTPESVKNAKLLKLNRKAGKP